ncbi:MAG: YggT family protein [Actinomycetota bacterium]|nr:YggT family protein [Actinomycetota bacterium]
MTYQQPSAPEPVERVERVAPVEQVAVVEHGRYNFRAAAVVGLIVGVIEVLIAGRFLGKLLGASTQSSFVGFLYGVTDPMVGPFRNIFANSGSSNNVFEPAALVAMVLFALIGWGIVVLIRIATAPKGARPAVR